MILDIWVEIGNILAAVHSLCVLWQHLATLLAINRPIGHDSLYRWRTRRWRRLGGRARGRLRYRLGQCCGERHLTTLQCLRLLLYCRYSGRGVIIIKRGLCILLGGIVRCLGLVHFSLFTRRSVSWITQTAYACCHVLLGCFYCFLRH